MPFQSIVHCINTCIFTLKPFHSELNKLNIAAEVLGYARHCFHAKLSNFKIVAVTPDRDCLQNFVKVLWSGFYLFRILWGNCVFYLNLQHHRQMLAELINFLIPVNHWLKFTFNSFDHAMSQKLVIICQKSSWLLWFHAKSPAKCVQNKLESALRLRWVLWGVHLHDIYSIFYGFSLIWLKASSSINRFVKLFNFRSISTVILSIIVKIENIIIPRYSYHVSFDSLEKFTDLLWISCHIETFHIIFNDNSDFLK